MWGYIVKIENLWQIGLKWDHTIIMNAHFITVFNSNIVHLRKDCNHSRGRMTTSPPSHICINNDLNEFRSSIFYKGTDMLIIHKWFFFLKKSSILARNVHKLNVSLSPVHLIRRNKKNHLLLGCYAKIRNFEECKKRQNFPKKRWSDFFLNLLPPNLNHHLTVYYCKLQLRKEKKKCNSDKYTFTEIVYTATNTNYGVFLLIRCKRKKKKMPKVCHFIMCLKYWELH